MSEKQEVGAEANQGTIQQLQMVFMYHGLEGGSTRDGQHRPYDNISMQPVPQGATMVVTSSSPAAKHPQHHTALTSKSVLAAWGTNSPGSPGIMLQCSNPAPAQYPHPEVCWCESHCPSHSPYKTSSAWCSHRHCAKVPHCTINGQGMCPCSLDGQKPQCPPCRQTRLPASSKARALLQNPSHSGSEHCK